ncbi:hypothetical protein D3C74_448450 [compost metagenome]
MRTEVGHGYNYAFSCFAVKYETGRIFTVANAQRRYNDLRLVAGQTRINFKHVGLQNSFLACCHFVSVIFHEAGILVMAHHFQQAVQGRRLPVPFAGKAVALCH